MNNAMAMNVAQTIQNLSKQTPGTIDIIVQAVLDQISQCLYSELASENQ